MPDKPFFGTALSVTVSKPFLACEPAGRSCERLANVSYVAPVQRGVQRMFNRLDYPSHFCGLTPQLLRLFVDGCLARQKDAEPGSRRP